MQRPTARSDVSPSAVPRDASPSSASRKTTRSRKLNSIFENARAIKQAMRKSTTFLASISVNVSVSGTSPSASVSRDSSPNVSVARLPAIKIFGSENKDTSAPLVEGTPKGTVVGTASSAPVNPSECNLPTQVPNPVVPNALAPLPPLQPAFSQLLCEFATLLASVPASVTSSKEQVAIQFLADKYKWSQDDRVRMENAWAVFGAIILHDTARTQALGLSTVPRVPAESSNLSEADVSRLQKIVDENHAALSGNDISSWLASCNEESSSAEFSIADSSEFSVSYDTDSHSQGSVPSTPRLRKRDRPVAASTGDLFHRGGDCTPAKKTKYAEMKYPYEPDYLSSSAELFVSDQSSWDGFAPEDALLLDNPTFATTPILQDDWDYPQSFSGTPNELTLASAELRLRELSEELQREMSNRYVSMQSTHI